MVATPDRPDLGHAADALDDALIAENQILRDRVAMLEGVLQEYRLQMEELLGSASWRVTSPLRVTAGRLRRLKSAPRRAVRSRRSGRAPVSAPTLGLFPPDNAATLLVSPPPTTVHYPPADVPRERRILVVAHVFYPEVWHDIADRLARIPEPFDLAVTLVQGRAEAVEGDILMRVPHAQILYVPNRGRDVLPLLELVRRGVTDGYDAVLKVHTKRSPHRLDGDGWRRALLDGVLPSPEAVGRMVDLFREDPDVGIVAPTGHLSGPEHWGSDLDLVACLASRLPMGFDPDELVFPAGSMYWTKPFLLRRLLDLGLTDEDFGVEAGQTDGTLAHAMERFFGVMACEGGLDIVESNEVAARLKRCRATTARRPRVLAFYLPQYHPIPENDAWWGEGFTDWQKVRAARPLFRGHRQPHLPGELGYYDPRDPEVLRRQAELARSHGVEGFIFYHYWFDGRRLLEAPMETLLADRSIDLPFALCWANENWTRRWDGLDDDVLIEQTYQDGWHEHFFKEIAPALQDPRYLRVGGQPMLVVYRAGQIPHAPEVFSRWREMAREEGHPGLHLLSVLPSPQFEQLDVDTLHALDGVIALPPATGFGYQDVTHLAPDKKPRLTGGILSYTAAADGPLPVVPGGRIPVHPGVMPGWDNTPRRGEAAWIFQGSNALTFRRWLRHVRHARVAPQTLDPPLIVNAWNEWAEGAHLDPHRRNGSAALEAIRDVYSTPTRPEPL